MADDRLIDDYLAALHRTMEWHRRAAEIVAEADDHLRSAVERSVAGGVDRDDAQRDALARFGDPATVAIAHATTPRGRLAVPTPSTRSAGVVATISGALWLAVPLVWVSGGLLYDRLGDDSGPSDELGSPLQVALMMVIEATLLCAVGTLLVTMFALHERHGGFGPAGLVGTAACGLGVAAALFGWFIFGWGSLLVVGTTVTAIELWRRDIVPRRWVLAIGAGPATAALCWASLRFAEAGGPDRFGDYQVANLTALTVASLCLGVGLIGLGSWLRGDGAFYIAHTGRRAAGTVVQSPP